MTSKAQQVCDEFNAFMQELSAPWRLKFFMNEENGKSVFEIFEDEESIYNIRESDPSYAICCAYAWVDGYSEAYQTLEDAKKRFLGNRFLDEWKPRGRAS